MASTWLGPRLGLGVGLGVGVRIEVRGRVRVRVSRLEYGEHDVVDVTEAGGLGALGVVQAARPVDGDVGEAVVQLLRAVDRAARVHAAVVVQAVEDRAVVADGELLQLLGELVLVLRRHALDEVDVVGRVELRHLLLGRHVRPVHLHLLVELVREDEVVGHLQAVRLHRVARPVVERAHRIGIVEVADLLLAARRHWQALCLPRGLAAGLALAARPRSTLRK
eukprot:scaffold73885_cov41-Phaeocystis_antarctica.AAC.2